MSLEVKNGGAENGTSEAVVFSAVKPQLFVEAGKANDAVQFYKSAFGAAEVSRSMHPKRKADQELPLVLSAELELGSYSFSSLTFLTTLLLRSRHREPDSSSAWKLRTWKLL